MIAELLQKRFGKPLTFVSSPCKKQTFDGIRSSDYDQKFIGAFLTRDHRCPALPRAEHLALAGVQKWVFSAIASISRE